MDCLLFLFFLSPFTALLSLFVEANPAVSEAPELGEALEVSHQRVQQESREQASAPLENEVYLLPVDVTAEAPLRLREGLLRLLSGVIMVGAALAFFSLYTYPKLVPKGGLEMLAARMWSASVDAPSGSPEWFARRYLWYAGGNPEKVGAELGLLVIGLTMFLTGIVVMGQRDRRKYLKPTLLKRS